MRIDTLYKFNLVSELTSRIVSESTIQDTDILNFMYDKLTDAYMKEPEHVVREDIRRVFQIEED